MIRSDAMIDTRFVTGAVRIRRGMPTDAKAIFSVHKHAIVALCKQLGIVPASEPVPDASTIDQDWQRSQSLFQHLDAAAEHFWVAEQHGQPVGYARSMMWDGVRELTEFFVHPDVQAAGVGQQLLARAFPPHGARRRCIIATIDPGAQALYLRARVYPRFPLYSFGRAPEAVATDPGMEIVHATLNDETLDLMADIDRTVLEHTRDVNHRWLLRDRQAYVYYRGGKAVGYGYVGAHNGPFALLNSADYPAVLAHAETVAAEQGHESFNLIVPLINETVVDYLLQRGFPMDRFFCQVMTDEAFGSFQNYIASAPMFFL